MTPSGWGRIGAVVESAADLNGIARDRFLDERCGGDTELRREVESYLAAIDSGGSFLDDASWAPEALRALGRAAELGPGDQVGSYQIDRKIGHGGMGTVYLARRADQAFERPVALKIVHSRSGAARFQRECFILARLEHANIARLYDAGQSVSGLAYMVMEYVDGRPIHHYCRQEQLGIRRRLELFRSVCAAVHFAHQNLILHRDLKPANILVDSQGEPRLLDFGIATLLDPGDLPPDFQTTATGQRPLTPLYASPEQIRGDVLTTASDVYALGLLLYELLAGAPPFAVLAENPAELARGIAEQMPPAPSQAAPSAGLSPDLDAIVLMTLRKEPRDRYVSADRLAQDVGRFMEGLPVLARRGSWLYRAAKLSRRYWQAAVVTGAFLVLTSGYVLAMNMETARTKAEREKARKVTDFMVEIFGNSSPEVALGTELTVEQAMHRAVRDLPARLAGQPEIRSDLELALGKIYRMLGRPGEALPLLDRAVAGQRAMAGDSTIGLAESLFERGRLEVILAQYSEAEADLLQALGIQRRHLGETDPATTATLQELGSLSGKLADWPRAQEFLSEALQNQRRMDPRSVATARTARELAIILGKQGQLQLAKEYLLQALEIQEEILPPLHPEIQLTVQCLAILFGYEGDMKNAEIYFRRSLAAQEKLLPEGHPDLLTGRHNLAVLYTHLGRPDEAEALFRQTLEGRERYLSTGSPRLFESFMALGGLLLETGRLVEAEESLGNALAQGQFLRQQPGSLREAIRQEVRALYRLGELHLAAGRGALAEKNWRQGLEALAELGDADRYVEIDMVHAMTLLRLEEKERAAGLVEGLLASGVHYPDFLELARQHELVE